MRTILLLAVFGTTACVDSNSDPLSAQVPPPPPRVVQGVSCSVNRIVDGDTFECGEAGRVRFIGIDAPEVSQSPFGSRSTNALAAILPIGTAVRLVGDVTPKDRYGRVLAYVYRDSLFVNEKMVLDGWAVSYAYPPDTAQQLRLRTAQDAARMRNAGHWGTGGFSCLPADHRRKYC